MEEDLMEVYYIEMFIHGIIRAPTENIITIFRCKVKLFTNKAFLYEIVDDQTTLVSTGSRTQSTCSQRALGHR